MHFISIGRADISLSHQFNPLNAADRMSFSEPRRAFTPDLSGKICSFIGGKNKQKQKYSIILHPKFQHRPTVPQTIIELVAHQINHKWKSLQF